MDELIPAISMGLTAFTATNLDDLVILTLFFSQVSTTLRRSHIVIGQYLGFMVLVLFSLPGFFGGMVLPAHWIGLLGLVPISIGLSRLVNPSAESCDPEPENSQATLPPLLEMILSPQTYGVAAITLANGSDNVGIYVPLFASSSWERLLVILAVFMLLVGVWCYVSEQLTRQPAIAPLIPHYGNAIVPYVLISLGVWIVLGHQALSPFALVASSLCLLGLVKKMPQIAEPLLAESRDLL